MLREDEHGEGTRGCRGYCIVGVGSISYDDTLEPIGVLT